MPLRRPPTIGALKTWGWSKELDSVSVSAPIDEAPTVWLAWCVPSHLLLRMNLRVGYYRQNHSSEGSGNLSKV